MKMMLILFKNKLSMNTNFTKINSKYLGFILIFISSILFLTGEIVNNRFWLADFEVYYKAAQRIIEGKNLYHIQSDGYYIFKYSPTSAIFFIPYIIFPFWLAKYVYWSFITITIMISFKLCIKLTNQDNSKNYSLKNENLIFTFGILTLAVHYLRELHLGQVNQLLCFMYVLLVYYFINNKKIITSLLLAISIFIKPFTLIFIPFLLIKRKFKELVLFIIFSIILFFVPFIFYGSISDCIIQYKYWINELQIELSHKQALTQPANHTIFSVLIRYTPLGLFLNLKESGKIIYQLLVLLGIGLSILWFMFLDKKNSTRHSTDQKSIYELSILISLISGNAFIFTQLLVFITLSNFSKYTNIDKFLAIIGFFSIGGDFTDLIGKKFSDFLFYNSFVSIGTLILIFLLFKFRYKQYKETISK